MTLTPSILTKEMGICKDWSGLIGFVLIRTSDDGVKSCNQASCTIKDCEYYLFRDETTQEAHL